MIRPLLPLFQQHNCRSSVDPQYYTEREAHRGDLVSCSQLGIVRVTRVVDAVAAGRIINTKTAVSQIMGSVVWGIGMALHEETLIDHNFGRVMNEHCRVPCAGACRRARHQGYLRREPHSKVNPMRIKGVGEIGIVGVAAAVANAIYHTTGKRVRDLPITLYKIIG